MAGTNLYWGRGEGALQALAEARGIPVFLNGLARGCVPADHALAFARARKTALGEADVALVVGVPMDFRLGFGAAFSDGLRRRSRSTSPSRSRDHPRAGRGRALRRPDLDAERARAGRGPDTTGWVAKLREIETTKRAAELAELQDPRAPLHPMRVYGELAQVLDRDAIVIGDGGDFVSFAGRVVDSYAPGLLAGPGPVRLPRAAARATRWRPSSRTRTGRSCCCSATARSASTGWSTTRSPATASPSWA